MPKRTIQFRFHSRLSPAPLTVVGIANLEPATRDEPSAFTFEPTSILSPSGESFSDSDFSTNEYDWLLSAAREAFSETE